MPSITFESDPSGAQIEIDGEYAGTTPCNIELGVVANIDMLVFVSPQYKDDAGVINSINTYSAAVKADIGWNVKTIKINDADNQYDTIGNMISDVYSRNDLKANMMVGEDMAQNNNVFHASVNKKCDQSTVFWQAYGGVFTSACANKIISSNTTIRVPTSLMYPNSNDPYATKANELITAFNKFSTNRGKQYNGKIVSLYSGLQDFGDTLTNQTEFLGDTIVVESPPQSMIDDTLTDEYKLFIAAGHGTPKDVYVTSSLRFNGPVHGAVINSPMVVLFGCNVEGWFTLLDDDCLYQPPLNYGAWFGHCVFDNPNLRVAVCGFPISNQVAEFIGGGCLSRMAMGKTVAESMRGIKTCGSHTTLFGDPTFHY